MAARAPSGATTAWWAYTREAAHEVLTTEIEVPMRDGVVLGAILVQPARDGVPLDGPFPGLVVEVTPYVAMAHLYAREAAWFAARGYVAVTATVRGAGRSGGTWAHAYWDQDGRDAHDLVEWLAAQPTCDGRVGQFGESYGGQTSYGSAVERPPHLRAIAPLQAPASLYDDVIYPGGIKSTEGGLVDSWPPVAQIITEGAVDPVSEFAANRAHPTFDEWWQARALTGRYDQLDVPVLAVGGWDDGYFRAGALANIEGALDRTWAIYGPWPHLSPVDIAVGFCAPDPLPGGLLLAWFDHWVMELPDVPIPPEPTFVSFEGPAGVGLGWRELDAWHPEGADVESCPLPGEVDLVLRQPAEPGDADGSIVWTWPPLTEDRVLLGRATLELEVTLTAPEAHLYVELLDLAPSPGDGGDGGDEDGVAVTVVNDGFLAASHRGSHVSPTPAPVGEPVVLRVEVRADHHRFPAGHAVGLRLSGGGSDRLTAPPDPVELTVHPTRSTLHLPGFSAPAPTA